MRAFAMHTTRNDMQATVCKKFPEVAEALSWLSQYGAARMSGSGACIFAPFDSKEKAEQVARLGPAGLEGLGSLRAGQASTARLGLV
jgi:4-diphosphocytidyl-2-C-methyl-D-erythritol kinase